jgi:hypothetical protein
MKKMDTHSRHQQNKEKWCQGTQWSPQEHPQWTNTASNHWEFHGDITRHAQPKHTRDTQEISRHQK